MTASRILLMMTTALAAASCIALMAAFPAEVLQAALTGVGIWWDVLFPALFPFFIIAELLLSFGIVHFFGTLLDPLMRPLFRIPGIGGFVMAMGFASGYPVAARLTSQLWDEKLLNREEGERLVAFTSTSDPIFLIGAVAVGFFNQPAIALILLAGHYGSSLIIGLLMRFHARRAPLTPPSDNQKGNILQNAFRHMHSARLAHSRPFGQMLQDATTTALRLVFVIGGLVVFFSVLIELLSTLNILQMLGELISSLLILAGMPTALADAFISGLFEVTLGTRSAGSAGEAGLKFQAAAAAFILSWAGLSVHAQIISLMSHTGMRYLPFLIARLLHGFIAMWMVIMLWGPLGLHDAPSIASWTSDGKPVQVFAVEMLPMMLWFALLALAVMTSASLFFHWCSRLWHADQRRRP